MTELAAFALALLIGGIVQYGVLVGIVRCLHRFAWRYVVSFVGGIYTGVFIGSVAAATVGDTWAFVFAPLTLIAVSVGFSVRGAYRLGAATGRS